MTLPSQRTLSLPGLAFLVVPFLPAQQPELAIAHVNVIPMDGPGVLEDRTILVGEGKILEITSADRAEIPEGCQVVDGRGRFLIPGLVDAHTHTLVPTDLSLYLAHGVTTILDMSGNPHLLQLREELSEGTRIGPRMFLTSPQLKPQTNPVMDREITVDSIGGARDLVRTLAGQGYDFIKVWGSLSPPVHQAVCETADEVGIRVTGHIPRPVGMQQTFANGQSSLAHVEEYWNKFFQRRPDAGLMDEAVQTTRAAGVAVVTTVITYENINYILTEADERQQARPELRWIDPARRMLWGTELNYYRQRFNLEEGRAKLAELRFKQRIAAALHKGGVKLVAGTDAGGTNLSLLPGGSLHRELELLVEAGLEPWEALATATVNAGEFLGGKSSGAIAPGQRADLVLLNRNPLEDIRNTRDVRGVVAGGHWFDRSALDVLLGDVATTMRSSNVLAEAVFEQGPAAAFAAYDATDAESGEYEPMALGLVAFVLSMSDRMGDTEAVMQRIMQDHPDFYLPYFMLGMAAAGSGDRETAIELLKTVLRLVPGHIHARAMLTRLGG